MSVPATAARAGEGRLEVARRDGQSRALGVYATTPLQLVVSRAAGPAVWAFAASHGGGLVDGDAIDLEIAVGEGARALVGTQASTKVYKRRAGGVGATQRLRGVVGPDALLAIVPEPVSCFADARFRQETRLELARGASLVLLEALVAGRVAAGERWAFDRYESALDVTVDGAPRLRERALLAPEDGPIDARMGRFDAISTVVLLGPALAEHARALLLDPTAPFPPSRAPRGASAHVTASPLGEDGALVRVAARDAETLAKCHRGILAFLPRYLGDDPFARRP